MPENELLKDFMKTTREDLRDIKNDVRHLMRFRWMVMGGAASAAFFFTLIFEAAKALARGH